MSKGKETYEKTTTEHRSVANTTTQYDDERAAAYRETNGIETKAEKKEKKHKDKEKH